MLMLLANRRSTHGLFTPLASAPASALLSVSPGSVRRGGGGDAPRRARYLRRESEGSTGEGDTTIGGAGATTNNTTATNSRYTSHDWGSDDDDGVLGQLSVNVGHAHGLGLGRRSDLRGSAASTATSSTGTSGTSYGGGPSKRSGRHSAAAGANPMTLREQEQVSTRQEADAAFDTLRL
jgi:hypothetical protein